MACMSFLDTAMPTIDVPTEKHLHTFAQVITFSLLLENNVFHLSWFRRKEKESARVLRGIYY